MYTEMKEFTLIVLYDKTLGIFEHIYVPGSNTIVTFNLN